MAAAVVAQADGAGSGIAERGMQTTMMQGKAADTAEMACQHQRGRKMTTTIRIPMRRPGRRRAKATMAFHCCCFEVVTLPRGAARPLGSPLLRSRSPSGGRQACRPIGQGRMRRRHPHCPSLARHRTVCRLVALAPLPLEATQPPLQHTATPRSEWQWQSMPGCLPAKPSPCRPHRLPMTAGRVRWIRAGQRIQANRPGIRSYPCRAHPPTQRSEGSGGRYYCMPPAG